MHGLWLRVSKEAFGDVIKVNILCNPYIHIADRHTQKEKKNFSIKISSLCRRGALGQLYTISYIVTVRQARWSCKADERANFLDYDDISPVVMYFFYFIYMCFVTLWGNRCISPRDTVRIHLCREKRIRPGHNDNEATWLLRSSIHIK